VVIEAHVLSVIDDLDARIFSFQDILDRETATSRWSGFQRLYNRYLYRWQGPDEVDESEPNTTTADTTTTHRPTDPKPKKEGGFNNAIRFSNSDTEKENETLDLPFGKK